MSITRLYKYFYFLVILLALTACSGIPEPLQIKVKAMPKTMATAKADIGRKQAIVNDYKNHKEWAFIKAIIDKENLLDYISKSESKLAEAEKAYSEVILPIIDRNEQKESEILISEITLFNQMVSQAYDLMQFTEKRIDFVLTVKANAPAILKSTRLKNNEITDALSALTEKVNRAQGDYSHKKDDLTKKLIVMQEHASGSRKIFADMQTEYNKKEAMDYAAFGDMSVKLLGINKKSLKYQHKTALKIDELYSSYTKILSDQKIDYFVTIGRATWCEGEYCSDGSTWNYPPSKVDETIYDYFENIEHTVARIKSSWGNRKFDLKITDTAWNALDINKDANWPRGDDHAEFWVEMTFSKQYHRYIIIENEKQTETGWKPVKEDEYWAQNDNLGLSIITKPFGYYEEDALNKAAPAGLAMIVKPEVKDGVAYGSNQYGEWRHANGNSFWHYYGQYAFFNNLLGVGSRYTYTDWNHYNKRPRDTHYYGAGNQYGTWGSSTYKNKKYANSSYARTNPGSVSSTQTATSNSKSSASVRGAGSAARSRGPGGGGK